jgi:hypothetical protein
MKSLLFGILVIVIVGFGGLVYRNAVEHSQRPGVCPLDALMCPDGTSVARTGNSCTFPACPPPNVSLADVNLAFAVPEGFVAKTPVEGNVVAEYEIPSETGLSPAVITISRFPIQASSTALATIQATAIGGTSGEPISATRFTSSEIGHHRFTIVNIERFEAVVTTAYYLARGTDVLRFDAIDRDVLDWTDPNLTVSSLPAHSALRKLLISLQ